MYFGNLIHDYFPNVYQVKISNYDKYRKKKEKDAKI